MAILKKKALGAASDTGCGPNQFVAEIIGWLQEETEADQVVLLGTYLVPFK